jgi:Mrp family chromosome partitioning ATPase
MTALDQAFIRAYLQQDRAPEATPSESARPTVPWLEALEDPPPPVAPAKVPVASLFVAPPHSDLSGHAAVARPHAEKATAAPAAASVPFDEFGLLATFYRADPAPTPPAGRSAGSSPVPAPHLPLANADTAQPAAPIAAEKRSTAAVVSCASSASQPESADAAAALWRPMLQVDHFAWSKTCVRLQSAAAGPLEQLAESLAAILEQGRRVIGLGGCGAGEGVTTLVLATGQALADCGLRVVVADADLADPQLARRLGLLPQSGWEDALAGRLPLQDTLVESIADRLTVLPVREPFAGTGAAPDDATRMAASLDTLAKHFDAVLVDLGSLEDRTVVSGSLARGIGRRLDAVVLVQNVRTTTPHRLAEVQECVAAAGMNLAGIIQNFVVE